MSTRSHPLVSVYVTTHNREDVVERAVSSVQCQTYSNIEIIICDDGSRDGTQSVLKRLARHDERIVLIHNEKARGACAARNKAIFRASGSFITGLDDDDEFTSDRIECFLRKWKEDASFLCSNMFHQFADREIKQFKNNRDVWLAASSLIIKNGASNQIFTRTERLREIGGFDESVRRLQDWDTWIRLYQTYGDFLRVSDCTYIMHHDATDDRVSKSIGFEQAYLQLIDRNPVFFDTSRKETALFFLATKKRAAKFSQAIKEGFKIKSLEPLMRFAVQHTKYNRHLK